MPGPRRLYGLHPSRLGDTEIGTLVLRELDRHTDAKRTRRHLHDLRLGRTLAPAANLPVSRLEALVAELPRLTAEHALRRRGRSEQLFDPPPSAAPYLRSTRELRALLAKPEAQGLLSSAQGREALDRHARLLFFELSDVTDRYDVLSDETGLFNRIVETLYPDDYPSLQLDAHHVVEERAFERFRGDWALLGWKSPDHMATIAVFHEHHIRSPKRLPGIAQRARELDAKSLSKELLAAVHPDRATDVFALIGQYRGFYARGGTRRALGVLDAIERRLSLQRSRRTLVRGLRRR
jgi:hypothetical protein